MAKVNRWAAIAALASCVFALSAAGCGDIGASAGAEDVMVGLITKTEGNPFFVAMEKGARQRAYELDVELRAYAGERDGDWESQAEAVAELVEDGAAGILITPSDPAALGDAVRAARRPEYW